MNDQTIRISEIFGPTIQGEGALIGQPTVFVRTGGCDYRCSWCDTLYAVESKYRDQWQAMSAADIMARVEDLSGGRPLMVTLSGGNPAIQPLGELIKMGQAKGYKFCLETQGSVSNSWFADLDVLTLSPKPPSSGMVTDWAMFDQCLAAALCPPYPRAGGGEDSAIAEAGGEHFGPDIALKIVIFDDVDYAYAQDAAARYPDLPLYLQAGNHQTDGAADVEALNARMRWLVDKVSKDQWFSASVLPQLHVMLWGNERGV